MLSDPLGPLVNKLKACRRLRQAAASSHHRGGCFTTSSTRDLGAPCHLPRFQEAKNWTESTTQTSKTGTEDVKSSPTPKGTWNSRSYLQPQRIYVRQAQDEIELLDSPRRGLTSPYSPRHGSKRRDETEHVSMLEALRELPEPPRAKTRRSDHHDRE